MKRYRATGEYTRHLLQPPSDAACLYTQCPPDATCSEGDCVCRIGYKPCGTVCIPVADTCTYTGGGDDINTAVKVPVWLGLSIAALAAGATALALTSRD